MTTVTVSAGEIRAEGHAGNRDVCLYVEAAFQTTARTLGAMDAAGGASMDVAAPAFVIRHGGDALHPIAALVSVLTELAARYPENLQIVRR